jgi:hypothetical protein
LKNTRFPDRVCRKCFVLEQRGRRARLEEARLMRRPLVRAVGNHSLRVRYPAFFSGSAFRCELISSRSPASVSHVLARVA